MISILLWIAFFSAAFPFCVWGDSISFTTTPSAEALLQCEPVEYGWNDLGTGPYKFVVQDASNNNTILFSDTTNQTSYNWIVNVAANFHVTVGVQHNKPGSLLTQAPGTHSITPAEGVLCALSKPVNATSIPLTPSSPTSTSSPTPPTSASTSVSPSSSTTATKPATTTTTSLNGTLLTSFSIIIALTALFLLFALAYFYYRRRKQHWLPWMPHAKQSRDEKELAAQISPFPRDVEEGRAGYATVGMTSTSHAAQAGKRSQLPRLVIPSGIRGSFKKKPSVAKVQVGVRQRQPSLVVKSPVGSEITYLSSPGGIARLSVQVSEEIDRLKEESVRIGETIELSRG